jgi:uncharacterized repeat protein (TIGR02543 family)
VSWTPVANASSYSVKIYASNGTTLLQTINDVPSSPLTVTASNYGSIADGTTYNISITAVGTGNYVSSSESLKSSVTTNSQYTITFNNNGGSGTMQTQTVISNFATALTANSFTRTGYTFAGWATSSGGAIVYANQDSVTASANLSLFATWTSDQAWNKVATQGNYASTLTTSTGEGIIPRGTASAWTFEAWVYPDFQAGVWNALMAQQDNSADATGRYSIWFNGNAIHLTTPTTYADATYTIPNGRWTHLAWVMTTGQESILYADGNEVWRGNMTRGANLAGPHFALGGSRQETNNEFKGHMDQVKIWNNVLTEAQVKTSMKTHGTFTGAPSLRAHYDFNTFQSGSLRDVSGNSNHLDLPAGTLSSEFTFSNIMSLPSTANTHQTYIQFNRSFLTAQGGWTPPAGVTNVKALIVGGGGGGGRANNTGAASGGTGGGGAVYNIPSLTLTSSVIPIVVGQGGLGSLSSTGQGTAGGDSSLGSFLVGGGGGGNSFNYSGTRTVTPGGSSYVAGGNGGGGRPADPGVQTTSFALGGLAGVAASQTINGKVFPDRKSVV